MNFERGQIVRASPFGSLSFNPDDSEAIVIEVLDSIIKVQMVESKRVFNFHYSDLKIK